MKTRKELLEELNRLKFERDEYDKTRKTLENDLWDIEDNIRDVDKDIAEVTAALEELLDEH